MAFFQTWMKDEHTNRTDRLEQDIASLSEEGLNGDLDELVERLASVYDYPDVPELLNEGWEAEDPEFEEGADHCSVRVFIPFKGDPYMFRISDRSMPMEKRDFEIEDHDVVATYVVYRRQTDGLKQEVEADIELLSKHLNGLRNTVPRYNKSLRSLAKTTIENRRHAIGVRDEATRQLKRGLRIRRRNDGAERIVMPVEVERKVLPIPERKAAGKEECRALEMQAYDDILETMCSMVRVMERSPHVFAQMEEEHLRTVLLVALNGLYKGQATGETFNGYGKSDILIRVEDKNVFLAECLVWGGQEALLRKMNEQLFTKYQMWRDTKVALIVFNRQRNFTHVVDTMRETVKGHKQFVEEMPCQYETAGRYRFRRHDDVKQFFTLTCLAFDVPQDRPAT